MLKEQHPYIDENGNERPELIRHYSDEGKRLLQVETGREYDEAIDVYPCRYTYVETDKYVELDGFVQNAKTLAELNDAVNALNILGVS